MANTRVFPQTSLSGQHQAGAALIAVLLFLILITIAGVIAVRQSSVDLKVATSDQANVLMLNGSDSVLADIEQTAQTTHPNYIRMISERDGILGYFGVQTNDKIGDQLHFCYRPSSEHLFSLQWSRILKYRGGYDRRNNEGLRRGVCNSNLPEDYASARNTTMTQVAVRAMSSETAKRFQMMTRGELSDTSSQQQTPSLSVHSATVLPSLSQANNTELSECLGRPVGDNVDRANYGNEGTHGNMSSCLRKAGIPSSVLVEDMWMVLDIKGGLDKKTGRPNNDDCLKDTECQKALNAK